MPGRVLRLLLLGAFLVVTPGLAAPAISSATYDSTSQNVATVTAASDWTLRA